MTLTKRIIPCLDIKDGRTVKGTNFKQLRDAGDPVDLAKRYNEEGADELVFLDITASEEKRKNVADLAARVAEQIFIPFTIGGGIKSVEDMNEVLKHGADKVAINTAAVKNPELISQGARQFGSQCIVLAMDVKRHGPDEWKVYIYGGKKRRNWTVTNGRFAPWNWVRVKYCLPAWIATAPKMATIWKSPGRSAKQYLSR